MLDHGVVQQDDAPEALYRAPGNRFVAQFLGGQPLGTGLVRGSGAAARVQIGTLTLNTGQTDLTDGDEVEVFVMAESVRILENNEIAGTKTFAGILNSLDFFGPFARADVDAGGIRVPVTMLSHDAGRVTEGDQVRFEIAPEGLHAFAGERVA